MNNFLPEFARDVPVLSISQSDNDGRIGSIRTQHDAMVDAFIANPTLTNAELAIMSSIATNMGLPMLTNSDLFCAPVLLEEEDSPSGLASHCAAKDGGGYCRSLTY